MQARGRSPLEDMLSGRRASEGGNPMSMSVKTKAIGTVLVFAIVGMLLNPQTPLGSAIFGAPPEEPAGAAPPPAWAIPALIGVGLVQALAFGAGFAFLFFGRPYLARLGGPEGLATWTHLAVAWSLLSWVPHSAMHMTSGTDLGKLVFVEYLFHVTLIAGGALLALYLVRAAEARAAAPSPRPAAAAHVLAAPTPAAVVVKRVVGQGPAGGQR
jgi:hypothetical protein